MFYADYSGKLLAMLKPSLSSYVKTTVKYTSAGRADGKVESDNQTVRDAPSPQNLEEHFEGHYTLGLCPANSKGECRYGIIDFDIYQQDTIQTVLSTVRKYSLPLVPCRSKSGGLHLYLILAKEVKVKDMIASLQSIISIFSWDKGVFTGKVEYFPNKPTSDKCGHTVSLPYHNAENPNTYSYGPNGEKETLEQFFAHCKNVRLSGLESLELFLSELPYNDAPPCIQRILLSNAVGTSSSHRNNFLFSLAVYLRKKDKDTFEDKVREVNSDFVSPLPDDELETILSSVASKEYAYKCKDFPCSTYCNKTLCKVREYGLNGEKGSHFSEIDFGQLYQYRGEACYYEWELRLQGDTDFVRVKFANSSELCSQKIFCNKCIDSLLYTPKQIPENDWRDIVNRSLRTAKIEKVERSADSSVEATIIQAFYDYLLRCCSSPTLMDSTAYRETYESGEAKYFFRLNAFTKYLERKSIRYNGVMLIPLLYELGVVEDKYTYYVARDRRTLNTKCLSFRETSEIADQRSLAAIAEEYNRADSEESLKKLIPKGSSFTAEDLKNVAESI